MGLRTILAGAVLFLPAVAWSTDIDQVQSGALDQPTIWVCLRTTATSSPLLDSGGPPYSYNFTINPMLDTGASGILLTDYTLSSHGVGLQTLTNGNYATFSDVGAVERAQFHISDQIHMSIAPEHPDIRPSDPNPSPCVDDPLDLSPYTHTIGPVRAQVSLPPADPWALDLTPDVVGMPAMKGKVTVLDPRPVDHLMDDTARFMETFSDEDYAAVTRDTIRTSIFAPGTAYDASKPNEWERGIPQTNRHVKLSLADFNDYTKTDAGAQGPTLVANPFIGPNPRKAFDPSIVDNTPPITIRKGAGTANGTFLLDTGAALSMISSGMAGKLGIKYETGTKGTDNPVLVYTPDGIIDGAPVDGQFQMQVSGITGTATIAGFYLDSLLLRTTEGDAANDNDPNHIRFLNAPVCVSDILLEDPNTTNPTLPSVTLDGVFGMNFLVASGMYASGDLMPSVWNPGSFDWVVFDEPNGILGLDVTASLVPEPGCGCVLVFAAALLRRRWAA